MQSTTKFRKAAAVAILGALTCAARFCLAAGPGAVTPFTSFEAETGYPGNGATLVSLTTSPTNRFSSPALEASGHAYVQLTANGQFVQWTNMTSQSFTAINIRTCIPDAPNGGGISNIINLYVNGFFRQPIPVTSLQNYCYEGTNYNGQIDKNPADGNPRGFWNDTHAFISGAPVAPSDTIRLEMDLANTAAFYYVDVIDLETPPPPLTQPSNALSILDYGAQSNNIAFDNTAAMNACFSAAKAQGKTAWIPPGTFYINANSGGLSADSVTITGAGPWHTTIYRVTPANNQQIIANIINATSCTLANVLLDCNANSRAGNINDGAVDFSGTNWLVTNVWIQHVTSSFWCAGVNGMAVNCRTLSTWADGGNFNNVQSADGIGINLVYSNNFVRGTGDDAMAINSVNYNIFGNTTNYYTTMSNIVYVNNTAICPWGGQNIGIYGGINVVVSNNLLMDSPRYTGLGVTKFGVNGSSLYSGTVIGNTVIRCGGNGYDQQQQAMMIGNGGNGQSTGSIENVYIASNTIIDALYDGVGFSTSTNIVLEYNSVIHPALDGFAAGPPDLGSDVTGYAVLNFNSVSDLNSGHNGCVDDAGNYYIGGIGNSGFSAGDPVPSPWLNTDVGDAPNAGGATYCKGAFALASESAGIAATNDAFQFVLQSASGNSVISARVVTEELVNAGTQTGLQFRNSLDPADMEASVITTPDRRIVFQHRDQLDGVTSAIAISNVALPCWLKLSRAMNIFSAAYSRDGETWTTLGSASILMQQNILAGLCASSGTNGNFSSTMIDNASLVTASQNYPAVHLAGDLIVNLQSSDLSSGARVWTNRTSNPNSAGNFYTTQNSQFSITNTSWNSQPIRALLVNGSIANAVQSAVQAPAEILGNNPVSAEGWIFATAVSQQNNCVIGYGIQGGPSDPQADREFNYSDPCCGGGVSGDFGSYDTSWATTPSSGAWHYLAWTYDGATVRLYLDGLLNAVNNPNSPLVTPATFIGIGAGIANSGPNISADAFQGCIAAARVHSGVLSASDVATNFNLGPFASAAAVQPAGLAAGVGDGKVTLSWNIVGNASSYNVKSAPTSNGNFTVVATNVTVPDVTIANLTNGQGAYFAVSAINQAGESPNSESVYAVPISSTSPALQVAIANGQIELTWPADHVGWLLQIQTNASGELGTNWTTISNSATTNQLSTAVSPTIHAAYFRLAHP